MYPWKYIEALKNLQKNEEIVIRAADKGGGVVISHKESINILSDEEFYSKITENPFPRLNKILDKLLSDAKEKLIQTKEERRFIKIEEASEPHFYHIPKIHKCMDKPPSFF